MTNLLRFINNAGSTEMQHLSLEAITLLLVGDDQAELRKLRSGLNNNIAGLMSMMTTGGRMMDHFSQITIDALIIQDDCSEIDGRNLCRLIRRKDISCPIIFMSDEVSDAAEISALDSGANDFVSAQIDAYVLAARVRAHVRQYYLSGRAIFRIGPYRFDPTRKILRDSCFPNFVELTEKECRLLMYFCSARDQIVTPEELLRFVWNYHEDSVSTTLKTHIYNVRKKICANLTGEDIFVKVRGGYRLIA